MNELRDENTRLKRLVADLTLDKVQSWRLQLKSDKSLEDLSRMLNPVIAG